MEIQGFLDGLQSPEDTAKHLENELDEVADLMDDLIFLASSDSSRRLMLEWVSTQELILQTVERFQGVPSMGRKIEYTLPLESIMFHADSELVQRAISNLLSNALRYTIKDGLISVELASSSHEVWITVKDDGCGIAEEHLPHIFDRFYRTDESRNAASGGRGLGLAIVQQIMEEHQGRVQIESQVGQGTTVTLIFPAKSIAQ
jgi:signal transduction histidine kinase